MPKSKVFQIIIFCFLTVSCTVTNNLYINDPEPIQKGDGQVNAGLSTGIVPLIDSVNLNGSIFFSNKYSSAPVLSMGAQGRINDGLQYRFAIHLPYIVGGFGIKGGVQHCFFPKESPIHLAIGADLGIVFAKESIKIFGTYTDLNIQSETAFSFDLFMPFSYQFSDDVKLIFGPRYSNNFFEIRYNENYHGSKMYYLSYPALSFGARFKHLYIETTATYYDYKIYPLFGIAFIGSTKN